LIEAIASRSVVLAWYPDPHWLNASTLVAPALVGPGDMKLLAADRSRSTL
jgi:hypothetical protein